MMLFFILAVLLLSVLKVLIILVLFIALGNLMQLVYQEMQCLTIMDIYEMHFKEISVKDRVQNFNFDYLIKEKKLEIKSISTDEKTRTI